MTAKQIKDYLVKNYGECKHDQLKVSKALKKLSKKTGHNTKELFHLIFENKPIAEAYTHSYGFHTRSGRNIIDAFSNYYYSL